MRASEPPRRFQIGSSLVVLCLALHGLAGCGGSSGQSNGPATMPPATAAAGGSTGAAGTSATMSQPSAGSSATAGSTSAPTAGSRSAAGSGGAGRAAEQPAGAPAVAPAGAGGAGSGAAGMATAGSSGGAAPAAGSGGGSAGPRLPTVTSVAMDGPFKTVQDLMSGPKRGSGLFRPMELGKDGLKHPVFLFGCGGGSNPSTYAPRLNRIASHGFVVLADVQNIGDNEKVFAASLDWLLAENKRADSPLYDKLDTTKIGAGGHSIGSVNAFFFAPDPRLTTTIHVAGGSLDNVNNPNAATTGMGGKSLTHPSAFITGDTDQFGNIEKAAKDYAAATVPVFFTQISGTDHIAAVEQGLPVIVAWLRWQLGGETERKSQFLDAMGEYNTGRYKSQSKNW